MAAQVQPSYGDAYWSLANLKTYRFSDGEIEVMRAQEAVAGIARIDQFHLCFALGKALEDRGEYAESFRYYERGNALKRAQVRYQPDSLERSLRSQTTVCTSEFFAARQSVGCDRSGPIFIVGLPRAGSTLLEQILPRTRRWKGRWSSRTFRGWFMTSMAASTPSRSRATRRRSRESSPEQLREFGEKYLKDSAYRSTGKPFFIDKMPNNFRTSASFISSCRTRRSSMRGASHGLLLQQFQTALRFGPGVYLQHRGHRAVLPHLC